MLPAGYASSVAMDLQGHVFARVASDTGEARLDEWAAIYQYDPALNEYRLRNPPQWQRERQYLGLNNPRGVAIDAEGALYVSDATDHVILRGIRPPTMVRYPENYIPRTWVLAAQSLHALGAAEEGSTVTFTAQATGGGPFQYQWSKGNVPIPGATGASLTLENVQPTDAGEYWRVTRNAAGSVRAGGELQVTRFHGEPIESVTYIESPRQTVNEGATVRFSAAVVGGTPPLHFQWYHEENRLPGANESVLVLTAVTPDQEGDYSIEVSNASYLIHRIHDGGLTVIPAVPVVPRIVLGPATAVKEVGAAAAFEVTVSGSEPLTFQWRRDGQDIPEATTRTLTLANLRRADAGHYSVAVSNRGGSATSDAAWLEVYGGAVPDDYVFTTIAGAAEQAGAVDGPGAAARFFLPQGLELDRHGNLFIADTVNHTIRKLSPDGVVSTIAGIAGQQWDPAAPNAANLLYEPTDVAVDDAGNVYVADSRSHSIRRIAPDGTMSSFAGLPGTDGWADGLGAAARFNRPWGLAIGGAGNVLLVADRGNACLRRILPDGSVSSLAGDPAQPGVVDGILGVARFADPVAIAILDARRAIVAESDARVVRGVVTVPPFPSVATLAGWAGDPGISDGLAGARLISPGGVAVDAAGNTFVTDATANTLRILTPYGDLVTIAGAPNQSGSADGPASQARFYGPTGIAVSPDGVLFVVDTFNSTIRRGDPVRTLRAPVILRQPLPLSVVEGEAGSLEVAAVGAAPLEYRWYFNGTPQPDSNRPLLNFPAATRSQRGRYVVEVRNALGHVLSAEAFLDVLPPVPAPPLITSPPQGTVLAGGGTVVLEVTTESTGPLTYQWQRRGQDLPGATGRTLTLTDVDQADSGLYSVVVANATGRVTSEPAAVTVYGGAVPDDYVFTTVAGQSEQPGSADGQGTAARFNHPQGIELDPSGNLFVADTGNHTIRKITPAGQVTRVAGVTGQSWSAAAPNAGDLLFEPTDLALDAQGNLFVADSRTHTIRKIAPNGATQVLAGEPGSPGSADGLGREARFNRPTGIAIDPDGVLYVADRGNSILRLVRADGLVRTFAGSAGIATVRDDLGGAERFADPSAIAVDGVLQHYVAELDSHVLRTTLFLPPIGLIASTLAGSPTEAGTADGPQGRLLAPGGVVVEGPGRLLVTDYAAQTLRRVTAQGVLLTLAGAPGQRGGTDGPASRARFSGPTGIAVDAAGRIFIADTDGSTIRRGDPVASASPPVVERQPGSQWVREGESARFEVAATGALPLSYQWFRYVVQTSTSVLEPLPGEVNARLTLENAQRSQAGSYVVRISNARGETRTRPALLTVVSERPNLELRSVSIVGPAPETSLRFEVIGADPVTPLILEASSDLVTWQTVATIETPGPSNAMTQPLGGTPGSRFFRARQ